MWDLSDNLYFPVYFQDWKAIRNAVSPEQGWKLFNACLNYAELGEPLKEKDPVIIAFFQLLSGGIDRSIAKSEEKAQKSRYARYCGLKKESGESPLSFEEWVTTVDACQQPSTHVNDGDNHNRNRNRNPIEIQSESESESKTTNSPKKKYGDYGWVKLTDAQYTKLVADLGQSELDRCIQYVDEYAQLTGNKKGYKDWNIVIRRCSREGWGKKQTATADTEWRRDAVIGWRPPND